MNIYFSGIGGVGIGPLAEIALDAGFKVFGSDPDTKSLINQQLIKRGVDIQTNQDGEYLKKCQQSDGIDWLVYTAALPDNHPELTMAKQLGIKISKRDEFLNFFIGQKGLKLIAISGTHGKTTTTGMLIWALKQLQAPISYSIGTILNFGPSGKYDSNSEYFIYEADEYDRNLLHYQPYLSLITSIGYDHFDTYKTQADYNQAFKQFALTSQNVITWSDQAKSILDDSDNILLLDKSNIDSEIKLIGQHNRENASLVLSALVKLGFDKNDSIKAINQFPGTSRRFEKLADGIYSDYAHHPTEIKRTIEMAREMSNHVVVIYQPHQNARQHRIKDDYTNQFELAEAVYWLPTYLTREDPNQATLKPSELIEHLTNKESVHIASFDDELWQKIQEYRSAGKLVICMGAGEIDGWIRQKLGIATN